jgi:hypothetical protein
MTLEFASKHCRDVPEVFFASVEIALHETTSPGLIFDAVISGVFAPQEVSKKTEAIKEIMNFI